MKLGIFLPNWIGDTCMAIPTLRALREGLGKDAPIVGISRPGPARLLEDQPWIDEWIVYRRRSGNSAVHGRRSAVRELRSKKVDTAVLLTNSISTALMSRLAGIPRRVGYARNFRSLLLTERLPVPRDGKKLRTIPAIDYYLALARYMGCNTENRMMELHTSEKDHVSAAALLKRIGFDLQKPIVLVNNNAAKDSTKTWSSGHVTQLASRLAKQADVQVLLHCGPDERSAAASIETAVADRRVRSMGIANDLPLGLSQALMLRSSIVVSSDSGPRHIAVALNCPVISLFGPIAPEWTTTYNQPETIIVPPLPILGSPKNHLTSINNITVEMVYKKTVELLSNQRLLPLAA